MPMQGGYYGQESVEGTAPQMADEIMQMSDEAKAARLSAAKKNLAAATGGPGPATTRAHEEVASAHAADAMDGIEPTDVPARVAALDKRADLLKAEADKVQESGTGNFHAQQTYLRAAALLHQQARDLHLQWTQAITESMKAQAGATTQPAATQPAQGQP